MPVVLNCIHALCAVAPLIATPVDPPKHTQTQQVRQVQKNPTPWRDASCNPVNYVIFDPKGIYDGLHVAMHIIENDSDIKWEKKLFCSSVRENKEGYF